ncbi:MAG TPA: phosphopantetheine-binding protein [Blastocatellia bacterium]|nr:phosphopantetheine-binding protein [Blastocatellia bacterium]
MLPSSINNYLQQAARDARTELPGEHESLFDAGVLDSFSLVEFVSLLETECGCKVSDAELRADNFDTMAKIEAYLAKAGVLV